MTRSMAIKWLKWIQNMFPEDSEQYKALQFAIDSMEVDEAYQLEYEQPTTKNDLGVDCIVDVLGSYTDLDIPYKREIADNILANLPSVTPQEPRRGHWIECMPGGAEEWCYKCSECDFWKYKKTINLSKFKFCPNCGASMVEPQKSEDKE